MKQTSIFDFMLETEMLSRGDMSNDELNVQIKPLIIHYQKKGGLVLLWQI